jgi:prepilin-type N-terminal cleavage/methylation domain-containing protein
MRSVATVRAFSLLELVVVLTIIATMAAVALPKFAGSMAHGRADAAADRLIADLAYARRVAIATSSSVTVSFNVADETYELRGLHDPARPGTPYQVDLSADLYRAVINSALFDATGAADSTVEVIFDGYGRPDSAGIVVIRVENATRTVVLDVESGRASAS